jgi:hypothetical protein
MFSMIKTAVAMWTLMQPVGMPAPDLEREHYLAAASALDIIDSDEAQSWFTTYDPEDPSRVDQLRERYATARDFNYPPSSDLDRFPSFMELHTLATINQNLQENFRLSVRFTHLRDESYLTGLRHSATAIESLRRMRGWPVGWKWFIRTHLDNYREFIGAGPYFAGHVPIWEMPR